MAYDNNGGVNNALKYFNDANDELRSFEIGGENKPPKWGPWSKKNVNKRRAKRARRKILKDCGKPGCSKGLPKKRN